MSWDAIGAIGEVGGAIAVVATLVYLSRQMRDQSNALRTNIRDSAFHQLQEWNYQVMADPSLAGAFQRGAREADWSQFEEDERWRLLHVMYSFFKLFENIYLHSLEGSVSPEVWERNQAIFVAYATEPGCQLYFDRRRPTFDPRFQEFVDAMERPAIQTRV